MGRTRDDARVVVLESTRPPDGTTRYVDQVVTYAEPRFEFQYLSVRTLLAQRFDVLHVHWPEVLVRGRNVVETAARGALLRALIAVIKLRRVPIVRTIHNLEPHAPGSGIERRAVSALEKATTSFVTLNAATVAPHGDGVHIPHGHYRDRFDVPTGAHAQVGRLLYVGRVEPYKRVDRLLEVFPQIDDPSLTLRIVGKPTDALRSQIESATQREPRITASLGWVSDDELAEEVSLAELVCLPYTELHNSGILLVALSLARPVLVPDTPTTRLMADEVGEGWVYRFDGELRPDHISAAIAALRSAPPVDAPRLDGRDWRVVAESYGRAFDDALRKTGRTTAPARGAKRAR